MKRKFTEEHRRKIGIKSKGRKTFLGKHHTDKTKKKMSKIAKKRFIKKENHPLFNKHHSKKTKEKISNSLIGRFKGKNSPHFGKKRPKKLREKMSLMRKGKNAGKKCHLWKGGISFEPYGIEFNSILKEKIRKKYNYRCQECFRHQSELRTKSNKSYKLIVHHIDFNKKNNSENNLIPLCRVCHLQTNFNRNDWVNYFQEKIK